MGGWNNILRQILPQHTSLMVNIVNSHLALLSLNDTMFNCVCKLLFIPSQHIKKEEKIQSVKPIKISGGHYGLY